MLRRSVIFVLVVVLAMLGWQPASAATWSRSFYWGVATAGFQSEGSAPDSNWSRYVATAGGVDPYGNAVDFRHRYAEDIALAAGMGVNTFRFSVEWAQVEPRPGVWDAGELAYYDDVVRHIRAAGMTPMITLSHWVYPGWVADQGGFSNPRTVDDFVEFASRIVPRYPNALWVTFNEPVAFLSEELKIGAVNPLQISVWQADVVRAHRQTYDLIHRLDPSAKVTSNQSFYAGFNAATDLVVMDQIRDKVDFVGLDYYYGVSLDNLTALNAGSGDLWNVKLQPEGIYDALRYYANRYPNLPLYIVENGIPTDNGKPRADGYPREAALRDSIFWVQRAKADGIDVIGYNYWSITDNYEWGSYRPRFGLYTVDALTDPSLTRHATAAVPVYRDVIANGGVPEGYRLVQGPASCSLVDPLASCLAPPDPDGPLAHLG
ncbi:glycoside hydrolase family 1 protein [Amycolatopsis alkalitolerans]|uniref:Glycoside hydrolase family 1 protein n=1 Tax=Amycolatopsis alkalitolerans TaxID=2547244 RepID=A0A5C4M7H4_9PSEU|nr:family 1 glycosylhydrolase [Amycolatopsis alkalitolerans]TNC28466.1 glycoside hydrolase family 1 protein [Amycolatopsis alkalitolerans]